MNYAAVKYCDIANGLGCRSVLFVSGCRNHCKGCFQPETWDFSYGKPFDDALQEELLDSLKPDYIKGLTLLGGATLTGSSPLLYFKKDISILSTFGLFNIMYVNGSNKLIKPNPII